jgi:Tat protein translocase TatB subunit
MFNIGLPELILIFIIALVVVGPDKLPEVAKTLGRTFAQIKGAIDEVKETIEEETRKELEKPLSNFEEDIKKEVEAFYKEANKTITTISSSEELEKKNHDQSNNG